MACRYWCGACQFRTPWLRRSQGEAELLRHYRTDHRGLPPEAHVETAWWPERRALGCLLAGCAAVAMLWVLALLHLRV